jgi:hypothetical protein
MRYFIQVTEYYMSMYAKIQDLTLYRFLQLNISRFDFLDLSTKQ